MRIKTLKLQNIRSYVEETISFCEGSQLLAGDIGAGKSTVLLAIEYALFGTKRGELEMTSLLRNGSHAGKIELTFDLHGKDVVVSRTLKRTAQSVKQEAGYLVVNNSRIDATPVELRARIIELLGYPKEAQAVEKDLIYRYTVFTPQENMRQIIYDDKEIRLNTLRKVFNIDKYKKIKENAQFISKEFRAQKRALEETITDIPARENEKLEVVQEKEKKEQERVAQEDVVKKQQTQMKAIENELAQLELLSLEHRKKKEQHAILAMQEKSETEQQYALLLQQEKNWTTQVEHLVQEIKFIKEAIAHKEPYAQQLLTFDTEIAGKDVAEKILVAIEQENIALNKEEASLVVAQKNAEQILARIPSLQTCTLCLQDVRHEHKEKISDAQKIIVNDAMTETLVLQQKKQRVQLRIEEQKKILHSIVLAEKKKAVLQTMLQEIILKEKAVLEKQIILLSFEEQKKQSEERKSALDRFPLKEKKEEVTKMRKLLEDIRFWEKSVEYQKNHTQKIAEKEEQLAPVKKECAELENELE